MVEHLTLLMALYYIPDMSVLNGIRKTLSQRLIWYRSLFKLVFSVTATTTNFSVNVGDENRHKNVERGFLFNSMRLKAIVFAKT